ncbi:GOLPH3/VPS74 family protein [Amycolatopsis sp. H20-H5]|uniref:GOLPH3/VPS74 family protein n=1 Tax=Amycolatopsis sp. H20-H5 TaxID=3046309 RepID=UPI002DB56849|nr:GPP34 family phosphoprotein [Amycolatopsis sp. H20-H5]MEC3975320.1 GPP34 family phosphoprotein [Amycolatopsis sp. H20-H5]
MLVAEELVLLVFDDTSGKRDGRLGNLDVMLAGAVLAELALRGRVELLGEGTGRLVVVNKGPTGSPVLDDAVTRLATLDQPIPQDAVNSLAWRGLMEPLLAGLADRGVLRREQRRVLGVFPATRWPVEDDRHEQDVLRSLGDVLIDGAEPDDRTAVLVGVLSAADAVMKVLEFPPGTDLRAVRARCDEIAAGEWASDAVRRAIASISAGVAAVFVATTAGS